jgi:hypothetical protein
MWQTKISPAPFPEQPTQHECHIVVIIDACMPVVLHTHHDMTAAQPVTCPHLLGVHQLHMQHWYVAHLPP